jgi:hypothetical protein
MALTKFNYNSFDLTTAASKGLAFNSSANGFETSSGTSMTLIKTLTASSDSTLSFVHGSSDVVLDSTYPVYLFKFISMHPSADGKMFQVNFSSDSGSNYNVTKTSTSFRGYHDEANSSASLQYTDGFDQAQETGFQTISAPIGSDNDQSVSGELYLFSPSSTTFVKHFTAVSNGCHSGDASSNIYTAGYGNTTSAIDAVQFKFLTDNMDSGTIKLYGIADS